MERAHIGESFKNIFKVEELRQRIFFTLAIIVLYRLGVHISLPGLSPGVIASLNNMMKQQGASSLVGLFSMFSGGGLDNVALFGLGIMPYITASIIMQLMTKVHPKLEEIVKEGPAGQRRVAVWTRWLTVPVAAGQAWLGLSYLRNMIVNRNTPLTGGELFLHEGFLTNLAGVTALVAGAIFVMWLGEQISEHGLGNGASILIMVGIVARLPETYWEMFANARDQQDITVDKVLVITAMFVGAIVGVVFMTQAQRRIPIQHAKHFRGRRVMMGSRNYLPLKVNSAGVMPLIFASALLVVPQLLSRVPFLSWMQYALTGGHFLFAIFYVGMIFFFSYFWTYLFYQPTEIAKNLKEYGSFIPGIRPGEQTAGYVNKILMHITFCGAAFLAVVVLFPQVASALLQADRYMLRFLGGTGILIVVGVNMDVMQKIESYLLMHHYGGFMGGRGLHGRR